jgi:peptidoglycan/LPS O-acetylase OafA/YrhL
MTHPDSKGEFIVKSRQAGAVLKPDSSARSTFRGDVEGLRAIAVGLVLIYHADSALLSGGFVGVDIFFVISGFLITGLLLAEVRETGTVSLLGFYGRRAKRLLPAAAVVLVAVGAMTVAFLPKVRWVDTGWDIVSSAFYVANWRFADNAVDYLAADNAPSPIQHFWSLAVEEQFYAVWPLLILLLVAFSRGRGPSTTSLLLGLSVIAVPSFLWSVHLTDTDAGRAFFVTTTRMWELAIGAFVAILGSRLVRLPRFVGAVLAWSGLAVSVGTAVLLTTATLFPGSIALVPTLGVAAVIAGGPSAGRIGPVALLGTAPMRAVGALSYSLYLWHWPMLVIARAGLGELTTMQSLAVVLSSALPAYLTYRLVENPIRTSWRLSLEPIESLKVGGLATLAISLCGLVVILSAWPPPPPLARARVIAPHPNASGGPVRVAPKIGALSLAANPRGDNRGAPADRPGSFTPSALQARDDVPPVYDLGCHVRHSDTEANYCTFGKDDSDFTVALVGDSHAAQWTSPLADIAEARGWRLRTYTKSSCPLGDFTVSFEERPYAQCTAWNRKMMTILTAPDRPDLVVTSNSQYLVHGASPADNARTLRGGFRRSWKRIVDAGAKVATLLDTPRPGMDIADCVSANENRLTRCAVARSRAVNDEGAVYRDAAAKVPGVTVIDLNDAICPTDVCAAVIGGVLVYRDSNHLTDTYARTLGPRLQNQLGPLADA